MKIKLGVFCKSSLTELLSCRRKRLQPLADVIARQMEDKVLSLDVLFYLLGSDSHLKLNPGFDTDYFVIAVCSAMTFVCP